MSFEDFVDAYVECALWSSTDNLCRCDGEPSYEPCGKPNCGRESGGYPLDDNYSPEDIAPESLEEMRKDCKNFLSEAVMLLVQADVSDEQAGHDFWLTRNGHGVGFWDRGLGEVGGKLTNIAHTYGGAWLYVGDDGKIYQG